jgi:hypothetical protein
MVEMTSHLSGKYLKDFDWKANVTLASSTASSLQIPFLQVRSLGTFAKTSYAVSVIMYWLAKHKPTELRDLSACSVHWR